MEMVMDTETQAESTRTKERKKGLLHETFMNITKTDMHTFGHNLDTSQLHGPMY